MTISGNRFVIPLIALSLGINVFLAGMIIGQYRPMRMFDHGASGGPPGLPGMLAEIEEVLPPQDADIFRKVMAENGPPPADQVQQDIATVQKILITPEFDAQAFHKVLQQLHDRHTAMDAQFVQSMTEAVSRISPVGRVKLAVALNHVRPPEENAHGDFGPAFHGPEAGSQ